MDLHLDRKVVIVTGGASGIGEAVVRLLSEEHAIPIIVDKNGAACSALVKTLKGETYAIEKDLASQSGCQECVEMTINKFGRIDGIVNNAGANDGVGLEKGSPEKFIQSIHNNLSHYYNVVHFALPHLKASKGVIVNMASKTALTGQGNTSGYVAAKGAILSLTREWAVELLPFGIRVNAVVPAEVWTPLYERWVNSQSDPEAKLKNIVGKIPLGKRMTTPDEIADATVFLLSDRASHMTGQWIHVDGGYVHLDRSINT